MANTLHEGTSFFIVSESGDVDCQSLRDSGLYYEDSRFLSRYGLLIGDLPPIPLSSKQESAKGVTHCLVNPRLVDTDGKQIRVRENSLLIVRRQLLDQGLEEEIEVRNFGDSSAEFTVCILLAVDFENIFAVKNVVEQRSGEGLPKRLFQRALLEDGNGMVCTFDFRGVHRQTVLRFDPKPDQLGQEQASFNVKLARLEVWRLRVNVELHADVHHLKSPGIPDLKIGRDRRNQERAADLRGRLPEIETDHTVLLEAYRQSVQDMISLRIKADSARRNVEAIAAGIPWYMTLFGRDSLIASYQYLLLEPSLARGTLKALADLQGSKADPISLEAPGKILHEYRHAQLLGNSKSVQKFPYYGTVDATPLFLITLSEYVRFTGDHAFAKSLWSNVERALEWIRHHTCGKGYGLLAYGPEGDAGHSNRGWKDSWDSVRFRDGRIAKAPISLVEVQGYVFDAYQRIAELAEIFGDKDLASELRDLAKKLQEKISSSYWMEDRKFFAEALDGTRTPVDSLTSNPGHLLWSGVLAPGQAEIVAKRLCSEEMFSGYGIRTMGKDEGGYNPVSYHNGSVWPHDNSLIIFGMVRYGLHEEARTVIEGLLSTLSYNPDRQFSELFTGFEPTQFNMPIVYPSACRPQAWASGSVPLLIRAILGLEVNATQRQLTLKPMSISGMSYLKVKGLSFSGNSVDIEMKIENGKTSADVQGLPLGWNQAAA